MKKIALIGLLIFLLTLFAFSFLLVEAPNIDRHLLKSKKYQRIVSLAPSFSETIQALKQTHRLVGITVHCQIENAANIKKVGTFASPNIETILALNPDLVLAVPHIMVSSMLKLFEKQGIEVFSYQPNTITDIKHIVSELSIKLDVMELGKKINNNIDEALSRAKNLIVYENFSSKRKAIIAVSHTPLVIAGKSTFASEIIESLGFENMAKMEGVPWPVWPLEKLISEPPQFFIVSEGESELPHFEKLLKTLGQNKLKNNIRFIAPKKAIFSIPSPSIVDDVEQFTNLIANST